MTDAAESANTNQRMETACKEVCKRSILRAMPPWLSRAGLSVVDNLSRQYRFTFPCPCHGSVSPTVKIPKAGAAHSQMVTRLVTNVTENRHLFTSSGQPTRL